MFKPGSRAISPPRSGNAMSKKYIQFAELAQLGIPHPRHLIEAMAWAGGFPRPIARHGTATTWLRADVESWLKDPSRSFIASEASLPPMWRDARRNMGH
jgi:predicted DNA-binding transcriptional regulator AlpA